MGLRDCVLICEELVCVHVKKALLEKTVTNAYRDTGDCTWEAAGHVNAATTVVQSMNRVIK